MERTLKRRIVFCYLIAAALLAASAHAAEEFSARGQAVTKEQKLLQLRSLAFPANMVIGVPDFDEVTGLIVREIAPKDPDWNPLNPRWNKLAGLVKRDIQREIAEKLKRIKAAAYESWNKALEDSLAESEVDSLLEFYRSSEGRRFISFQRQIDAIGTQGLTEMGTLSVSGLTNDSATASVPSKETIAARQRLLNMSMINLIMERQYESDKGQKVDRAGYSSASSRNQWSFANFSIALDQGTKLDLLEEQYASEIVNFEKLSHSSLMSKFIDANLPLLEIMRTAMKTSLPVIEEFIKKHSADWQRVYNSGE